MSSGLLEPPDGGEHLCVFLLKEDEEDRRREVGCQWESPEEEKKEVGCQWESPEEEMEEEGRQSKSAERRDAGVQVDLLTQQLNWRHSGSSATLLQCFSVGPHGGALLQHCNSTRTRTRIIKPAIRTSPEPIRPRSRSQRRSHRSNSGKRRRRTVAHQQEEQREEEQHDEQQEQEEEEQLEEQKEEEEEDEEDEEEQQQQKEELDVGDPTWTPPDRAANSQHAPGPELKPGSIICDVCGKVMKNKSSLARHSFIHTGMKPFACHLCDLRFNRRDNLRHHLSRLHPDGVVRLEKRRRPQTWLCPVCGKTFCSKSRLKTHEVIHSGVKPHRCDLCPKAYMRTNDLEHHKKMMHVNGAAAPPQPASLLCHFCGKEFRGRSQLSVHFQTHTGERPHLCDVCGRKFSRQYQLKRHKILVHVNRPSAEDASPPPFSCHVCGKRLKSEALLDAHVAVHAADKPHRCAICLRSFLRAACLKQHHVRVHLRVKVSEAPHAARGKGSAAAAAKAFPCHTCGKVFRFRSLLASHSLVHGDVRPFGCDFCSRRFRRLSHLKRHREVVHANGERLPQSFVCHICGKDKKCRSQLARHVIIHTGERPYACELCPARFNRSGNLQQHRKRMHGVHAAGAAPGEDAPPILFDSDLTLTYKQEETAVAVDSADGAT